jgi:putative ABC transport system permease protein
VFTLRYLSAELRRRLGRTILTALGLAVGVALVASVTALSRGLDQAQDEILQPLTGIGSDMTVSRPLRADEDGEGFDPGPGGVNLTPAERDRLIEENSAAQVKLEELGEPGDPFETVVFVTSSRLTFAEGELGAVRNVEGVAEVAGGLTLSALYLSGTVPEPVAGPDGDVLGPRTALRANIDFEPAAVAGVDVAAPELALVAPSQIVEGEWFAERPSQARDQVVLSRDYAARQGVSVGERLEIGDERFRIVGLAEPPLGGEAADVSLELGRLQALASRESRLNILRVRAEPGADVGAVAAGIEQAFPGAQVVTAEQLADRVGGSLVSASDLADSLGTVLAIVAMVGAVLIATLLTLGSVAKRTRELGTLRAIGWTRRRVIRQVTLESAATGVVGGVLGAGLGIAAAAVVTALGPTLSASVAGGEGGQADAFGFGVGAVAGVEDVTLGAPVDLPLVLLAVALAVLGGLVAGVVGGLRAARLRPADALRSLE